MIELLKPFAAPYPALLIALGLVLFLLRATVRSRNGGGSKLVTLTLLLWLTLWALSTPVVGHFLARSLEASYPPDVSLPTDIKTVVVLGGGRIPATPDGEAALPTTGSQQRCLKAIEVLQELPEAKVLLCGGRVNPREPGEGEAELMAEYLREQGVDPDRIELETESQNTYENVEHAAMRLRERDERNIVLVTHARHLKRSSACFSIFGVQVVPVGCARSYADFQTMGTYLPSVAGLSASSDALHEWLGILYYMASGKI